MRPFDLPIPALCIGLAMTFATPSVYAQAQYTDAESMVLEGLAMRELGRDREALAMFLRAHAIAPSPRTMAQIGLAEQALGRWAPAEAHLSAAIGAVGDRWVERHRAALETSLAFVREQHTNAQPSAMASSAPGAAARTGTATGSAGVTASAAASVNAAGNASPQHPTPRASTQRTVAYVTAGGALLALGGGILAHAIREQHASTWNSDACISPVATRRQLCGAEADGADRAGAMAVAGYATAGVLTAVSVVLFAIDPSPRESARHASPVARHWRCSQGPGDFGVACGGVF